MTKHGNNLKTISGCLKLAHSLLHYVADFVVKWIKVGGPILKSF